jgi:CrcB protein
MVRLAAVFAGGAAGTLLRIGLQALVGGLAATFAANAVGSFLLAALYEIAALSARVGPSLRLALGVGLCGGFTTYSTFNLEVLRMLERGRAAEALAYLFGTLAGCAAAGAAGLILVRWRFARRP